MINDYPEIIFKNIKNPTNCEVKIFDLSVFYQISVNQKHFDNLDEISKIKLYEYLNKLEKKIKKLKKQSITAKVNFDV